MWNEEENFYYEDVHWDDNGWCIFKYSWEDYWLDVEEDYWDDENER